MSLSSKNYIYGSFNTQSPTGTSSVSIVYSPEGEVVAESKKIYLSEKEKIEKFEAGKDLVTFKIGDFVFGMGETEDLRYPEHAIALREKGASAIIYS